jgi:hypothetical protein
MSRANYGSGKFEFVDLNDILPGVPVKTERIGSSTAGRLFRARASRGAARSSEFHGVQINGHHVVLVGPASRQTTGPTLMACTEYIMLTDLIGRDKSKDRRERQFHGRMHCLFDWFSFLIVVVVCEPIPVVGCDHSISLIPVQDDFGRTDVPSSRLAKQHSVQIADGGNVSTVRSTMQGANNLPTTVSFQITTFCLDTGNSHSGEIFQKKQLTP